MIDVGTTLSVNSLDGNIYLFDNMKSLGSTGHGTGDFVTAIKGTHWFDGSQANEQVLNWMVMGLGAVQRTPPKTIREDKARARSMRHAPAARKDADKDPLLFCKSRDILPETSFIAPILTDISGEAVDKKIFFPAEYESPDLASDGWYWSASVNTANPGTYAYTMHFLIYRPYIVAGECVWKPLYMTHQSRINITSGPKRNGFTDQGVGFLPIA